MNWIEVIVHTTTEGADWVSDCLVGFGAAGTMIEDRADIPDPSKPHGFWEIIDPKLPDTMPEDVLVHAWFEDSPSFPDIRFRLEQQLREKKSAETSYGTLSAESRTVSEDAWANTWKNGFEPFYVTDHLVIKPTWEDFTPAAGDRVIEIDPGMAFGSGTHDTTAMCISLLEKNIHGGETVVDVGTGSGILAISAALFGAGRVLAVDIDPDAVRVAAENVKHNRVDPVVSVQYGDLLKRVDEAYDICVVNIISDIIVSSASAFKKHIRPGGLLICSAVVLDRVEEVRSALLEAGYEILEIRSTEEWAAFLARRNDK